jgi:hypothetical protein
VHCLVQHGAGAVVVGGNAQQALSGHPSSIG